MVDRCALRRRAARRGRLAFSAPAPPQGTFERPYAFREVLSRRGLRMATDADQAAPGEQPGKSIAIDAAVEDTPWLRRHHGAGRVIDAVTNRADPRQLTLAESERREALDLEDLAARFYRLLEDSKDLLPLLAPELLPERVQPSEELVGVGAVVDEQPKHAEDESGRVARKRIDQGKKANRRRPPRMSGV